MVTGKRGTIPPRNEFWGILYPCTPEDIMTRWEFEEILGERKILRHYTKENLEEDIEYARSHQ